MADLITRYSRWWKSQMDLNVPTEEPKSAALANRYGLPILRVAATEFHILLAALLAKLVLIIVYVMDI